MLVKHLFIEYFSLFSQTLKPSTYLSNYHTFLKHFNDTDFGNTELKKIDYIFLQRYFNNMLERGYQPKTAKNILSILNVVFNYGVSVGKLDKNFCNLVKLPKFDNKIYFRHSTEVQQKIIKSIIDYKGKYCNIFLFLLHGRRKNEVLTIKWCDIDFKNNYYTIRFDNSKISKSMDFYLTPLLKKRLEIHYEYTFFNSKNDYVFVNPDTGDRYKDIRRGWASFLKLYDLPKMRLHDIRHLLGTYCVNHLNLSLESVMYTLGHSNIQTTHLYVHQNKELSKLVLNALLDSVTTPKNIII